MTYVRNINGNIVTVSLPNTWKSETINCGGGFASMSDAIHQTEGFYKTEVASFDTQTQKLGAWYLDGNIYKRDVEPLSEQEIIERVNSKADEVDSQLDTASVKKLLLKVVKDLAETEQGSYADIYPTYQIGKEYLKDDKFSYNGVLYKCIPVSHISSLAWKPDLEISTYLVIYPEGYIPTWRQPLIAEQNYQTGDQVWFPTREDDIWESLIDNNSWGPITYPAGWVKI